MAWGATSDVPLPEIYHSSQPGTWTSVENSYGAMIMYGAMTECTSPAYEFSISLPNCSIPSDSEYAPSGGWNALLSAQQPHGWSTLSVVTNIKLQGA